MKTSKYQAVKGMQDSFPEESRRWVALETAARGISARYGYGEIRIPLVEPTELFVRSIGEATDIVEKEMFTFSDAGEKSLTLRPEGTAGVIRAYLEAGVPSRQPGVKYYYLGPMFRRERPQAGRRRQFHQFGTEALGSLNPALDVEAIDLLCSFLDQVGLKDWELGINSVGCSVCRPGYEKELASFLGRSRESLCDLCRKRLERNVLRVLDCKNPDCRKVLEEAPVGADFLCGGCRDHFETVKELLSALSIKFTFKPFMVRGLDYYTRTVFEVYGPSLGAQDAVAGGGRYDNLIEELGGPSLGAVGLSVGMERLLIGLENREIPAPEAPEASVYCVSADRVAFRLNFILLAKLRKKGIKGEIDYRERSIKAQMREANRSGADYALIRGAEEIEKNVVKVKEMETGEEELLSESEVVKKLSVGSDRSD